MHQRQGLQIRRVTLIRPVGLIPHWRKQCSDTLCEAPRYFLRDCDRIYGISFRQRVRNMGVEEVIIAPRSPLQNPYIE
jgi:hypothetical protein